MNRKWMSWASLAFVGLLSASMGSMGAFAAAQSAPGADGSFKDTRTITRTAVVDGASEVIDSRRVTVAVDKTQDLRGRERINVRWSGAHPSGGRASNPYGETGMAQEYPVVIMQCRGLDDPTLPLRKQLSPDTCWTSTRQQRSQSATEDQAIWRHDQYATDADREQKSGMTPYPDNETCQDVDFLSTHITPFRAASGKVYPSCTAETMPPEAAVGAAYPPSEISAYTNVDGTGTASFEVRTEAENESLGCSSKVACSLVVIPIMGISCIDDDRLCNSYGRFAPGSSNFAGEGVDAAVSPLFWWSASNWQNRFTVPLTFGLAPDACDVLDSRAPTAFYGSELMSQAALQWAPAYCLRKSRFKFQHNRMSDSAAFSLMESGQAAGAFVSSQYPLEGTDPVAYAPTAVTGFAVSYVIDKPNNAGEFVNLRLNARLIAKLLTQSYPASSLGTQHPGMSKNPLSLNVDPEFKKLNPRLDERPREAAATLLAISQSSDVMYSLTSYIESNKQARDFVAGKPDPWGMKVNPSYRGLQLPLAEWPLLDTFVPKSDLQCLKQNPSVYLSQVAAPVSYLRTIAEAVLDAWPNVQTRCDRPTPTDPFKLGRVDRQGVGSRFMLGLTSLGDAARFGLHTAALQTGRGNYVVADNASLSNAIDDATAGKPLAPFTLKQSDLAKDRKAYPGTMIVYTAARTTGLGKDESAKVAQFIRVATTEGQQQGSGNGELPEGFLPIRAGGATHDLAKAAAAAATAIALQKKAPVAPPDDEEPGDSDNPPKTPSTGGSDNPPSDPPGGENSGPPPGDETDPPGDTTPEPTDSDEPVLTAEVVPTAASSSTVASSLLPAMAFLIVIGGVASVLTRLWARRPGP